MKISVNVAKGMLRECLHIYVDEHISTKTSTMRVR